jgi:hypothetical protein
MSCGRWPLTTRLRGPHGMLDPYGFDYETWLFERNIRATGQPRVLRFHCCILDGIFEAADLAGRERMLRYCTRSPASGRGKG